MKRSDFRINETRVVPSTLKKRDVNWWTNSIGMAGYFGTGDDVVYGIGYDANNKDCLEFAGIL